MTTPFLILAIMTIIFGRPNDQLYSWDFTKPKKISYHYEDQTTSSNSSGQEEGTAKNLTSTSSNGMLVIQVQEDTTADLILQDLKRKTFLTADDGTVNDSMEHTAEPLVMQNMKPTGGFEGGQEHQNLLLSILFPLPAGSLAKGDSEKIPLQMPFNLMGLDLYVKGYQEISLTDFVEVDGRQCARFETRIDISDLDVPKELEGEYSSALTGHSTFYFDIERRYFVSGDLEMKMDMKAAVSELLSMATTIDMVIRIRLKDIEK